MRKALHPSQWIFAHYWGTALLLLIVNFFGPRGLVSLGLSFQDIDRLEARKEILNAEVGKIEKDIALFKQSSVVRQRILREELGFLKADELSIEMGP